MAVMSMVASMVPSGPLFLVKAEENEGASQKTSSNVSAEALNVDVDFYDYNITKYKNGDGDTVTAENRILLNDYMIDKFTTEETPITEKNIFLFGGDRVLGNAGAHNVWTGAGKGPYQGIVSEELATDGSLQFNNDAGIYGVDMFPDEGDTELAGIVDCYYDSNFQFLDEDGTYIFDSDQFCASGLRKNTPATGSSIDIDFSAKGPLFSKGTGSKENYYGFFPFNKVSGENNSTNEPRHHMFGMKMELDFYMPKDGKIGTKSNPDDKNDMIFSFSGDDDVWVYIDGKLALDLGGIHDVVSGSINFATGDVESTANESNISHNITNIYKNCGIEKDAYSKHTLTMFYLERGEYDSNCKITFNLPSLVKTDDIAITKKAEDVPEDKTEEYKFQLLYGTKHQVENENTANVFDGEYTVYDASNKEVGKETAKDGIISLAAGETAVVSKEFVGEKQYYKVKELIDDPHYETEWGATGLTADEGVATYGDGTETTALASGSEESEGNTIIFTNKYKKWTNFTLKKALAEGVESSDKFEFLVTIGDKEERVVLKAGEEKTWNNIPVGTVYEVRELVTGSSIYTTPDVTADQMEKLVVVEKNTATSDMQNVFVVSGSVLQTKEEGAETKVLYINNIKEENAPTPEPTKTPTPEPTKIPTSTPVILEEPTQLPLSPIGPAGEETGTPEETVTSTPVVTEEPTAAPMPTPTPKPTETPVVIDDPSELPNAPVAEDDDLDSETDEDEDYNDEEEYDYDEVDDSEDEVEIIGSDDIPNELPQTGGLGTILAQKNKGIYAVVAVFASGIAMGIYFIRRRRTNKKS